jgi:hypothetical protein
MKITVSRIRKKFARAVPSPPPIWRTKDSAAAGLIRSSTASRPASIPWSPSQAAAVTTSAWILSWYSGSATINASKDAPTIAASGNQISTRPSDSTTIATGKGTRRSVSQSSGGIRMVASTTASRNGTTIDAASFSPPMIITTAAAPSST